MPQFVIEREMPGVGKLGADDLRGASQGSCTVLRNLGSDIQWVHSLAPNKRHLARNVPRRSPLPADWIAISTGC